MNKSFVSLSCNNSPSVSGSWHEAPRPLPSCGLSIRRWWPLPPGPQRPPRPCPQPTQQEGERVTRREPRLLVPSRHRPEVARTLPLTSHRPELGLLAAPHCGGAGGAWSSSEPASSQQPEGQRRETGGRPGRIRPRRLPSHPLAPTSSYARAPDHPPPLGHLGTLSQAALPKQPPARSCHTSFMFPVYEQDKILVISPAP